MSIGVTVSGNGSTVYTLPFSSQANAAAAQSAMAGVSYVVAGGFENILDESGHGAVNLPAQSFLGGAYVGGSALTYFSMPVAYNVLLNNNTGFTAVIGGPLTTVVSGANANLLYVNSASNGEIFLGGGHNYISEAFSYSAATINLDGGATTGTGIAVVDGTVGSTTVNLYNNAFGVIEQGDVSVVAEAGEIVNSVQTIDTVDVSVSGGTSTVPVTVSGTAYANIVYLPGGGSSFINPGADNVSIIASASGGTETLFGGAVTVGGVALSAPSFTGSATVFGGNGFFEGGSAGNNYLSTSTTANAATLVGGGTGDSLIGNAAGDHLTAGAGNETLVGMANAGEVFKLGNGSAVDYLNGNASGSDTISLGSGTATIALYHTANSVTGINAGTADNLYEQSGISGGHITIVGFAPLDYGLPSHDQIHLNVGVTATFSTNGAGNAVATLSDNTVITFSGVTQVGLNHVTVSGSTIT
jgi:hypothetical protein